MIKDEFPVVRLKMGQLIKHIYGFMDTMHDKSKSTQLTYQRSLLGGKRRDNTKPRATFIEFFVMDRKFFFRVRDVERYRNYLLKQHKMKEISVSTYLTAFRRFCQYLVEIGVLEKNPAKRVQGGKRPRVHFRPFLTLQEIDQLLASIDVREAVGLRDKAMIRVMLGCACSEIEIARMNIGDLQPQGRNKWVLLVQGKGKTVKDEAVPVPLATVTAIHEYLKTRVEREDASIHALPHDAPMFTSYSNRSMNARVTLRGIREAIVIRMRESGIRASTPRQLTPFSLRHTAGILLVEQGATVEDLMHRMRIEWRPTAMLYFKQKGKLRSNEHADPSSYLAL
jgi:site-specific recombinase XerC